MNFSALKDYDEMVGDAESDMMQGGGKNNSPRAVWPVILGFEGICECINKSVGAL